MGERAESDGTVLTVDEWSALDGSEDRRELVDGMLQEQEVTGATHDLVVALLLEMLGPWVRSRGGFLMAPGVRYALDERSGRIPDGSIFLDGRRPAAEGVVAAPPDVVVEVVSPTPRHAARDRVHKMRDYARFGVRFYWIVDPTVRSLEVNELTERGTYQHALGATKGVVADVPGCPGLVVDLDALWAEVDRLRGA